MARFGQEFIRSLTNPSYSEGLFQLGGAIGSTPARAMEEKQERTQLGMMRGMSPLQQAQFSVDNAKTAEELRVATARRDAAQQADTARRQQEATLAVDELKMVINDPMSSPQEIAAAQAEINQTNKDAGLVQSPTANLGSGVIDARTNQQLTEDANEAIATGNFKKQVEIGRLMSANGMQEGTALIRQGVAGLQSQTSENLEQEAANRVNFLLQDFSTNREAIRDIYVEQLGFAGLAKFNALSKTYTTNKDISDTKVINTYASQALADPEGPAAFIKKLRETNPEVLQQFEGKIISQIQSLNKDREDLAAFASTGVLTEEQLDYLDDRPSLVSQYGTLLKNYIDPSIPGQRKQAGIALLKIISEDRKRVSDDRTSENSIKIKVADTLLALEKIKNNPNTIRSPDLLNDDTFDALENVMKDPELNRQFELRLSETIRNNPDAIIGEPQVRSILQKMDQEMRGNVSVDMLNEQAQKTSEIRRNAIVERAQELNPDFMNIESEDERNALIRQATKEVDQELKNIAREKLDSRMELLGE